jgi:hypothetical protein
MSKNTPNVAVDKQQRNKILLIAIVCIVTALVLAASLIIALLPRTENKSVADLNNETGDTSDAIIANGDFEFLTDADATAYPKLAQNWLKYGYKAPASKTSHGYTNLGITDKGVMGVVDTSVWSTVTADLSKRFASLGSLANPEARPDAEGSNVYMIHNEVAQTASIYSSSFSLSATSSIKVTLWLKTVGVRSGEGAFVMIKQQSSSALEQSSLGVQYWYAHKGVVDGSSAINTNGAWEEYTFYVFNQTNSSKTVYINVGLGNVYTNDQYAGTLFIDDIVCDKEVTSNELRVAKYSDRALEDPNTAYMIEAESNENVVSYVDSWTSNVDAVSEQAYLNSTTAAYPEERNGLLPAFEFVTDESAPKDYINTLSNDGSKNGGIYADTDISSIVAKAPATAKQLLISIWVRVAPDNNKQSVASVYLRSADGKDLAKFTDFTTSEKLDSDTNNGWTKYSFYVQPSDAEDHNLSIRVALGPINRYEESVTVYPKATLYFTDVIVEEITQSQYASASTGSTSTKYSLNLAKGSSTFVSNNTFSNYVSNSSGANSSGNLYQPTDWTPVYAGDNAIFRDGRDAITVNTKAEAINAGVLLGSTIGPDGDDQTRGVLAIDNKQATSFGYLSDDITFAANKYYVLSVLAKKNGGSPAVYLLDKYADSPADAIIGSFVNKTVAKEIDGRDYFLDPNRTANDGGSAATGGWTRYYFVVATGDSEVTAQLALFNGAIDATATSGTALGTVYFDKVTVYEFGSYTRAEDTDRWETDADGEWVLDDNDKLIPTDEFETVTDDFATYNEDALFEDFAALQQLIKDGGYDNIVLGGALDRRFSDVIEPDVTVEEEVTEPEEETSEPVDWALLVSIMSSGVLVAALLIVVIVKFVFKKQPTA